MNISRFNEDLEPLENKFDFITSLVFTAVRLFTLILGIIVHRAFYKLMKRLPGRSINQIIYPYMVIFITLFFSCRPNGFSLISQRVGCDNFSHRMHNLAHPDISAHAHLCAFQFQNVLFCFLSYFRSSLCVLEGPILF